MFSLDAIAMWTSCLQVSSAQAEDGARACLRSQTCSVCPMDPLSVQQLIQTLGMHSDGESVCAQADTAPIDCW